MKRSETVSKRKATGKISIDKKASYDKRNAIRTILENNIHSTNTSVVEKSTGFFFKRYHYDIHSNVSRSVLEDCLKQLITTHREAITDVLMIWEEKNSDYLYKVIYSMSSRNCMEIQYDEYVYTIHVSQDAPSIHQYKSSGVL